MLLLFPPAAKACEPPAGIGYLTGFLNKYGINHTIEDLNLACLLATINAPVKCQDKWSQRAAKNRQNHLESLRLSSTYTNFSRYERAVNDINRLLQINSPDHVNLTLANYEEQLSPTNSKDLLHCFHHPEKNIFYDIFSKRIDQLFEKDNFSHVGISLNYLSQALCAFSIAGYIRRNYSKTKIIMGGGLITSWMRSPAWTNKFDGCIDHLIAGSGEAGLAELLQTERKENSPIPDYTVLSDLAYLSPGFILPYSCSFGCYWNKCAFCPEKAEKTPYLPVSQTQIRRDLANLVARHKPVLIHFLDNTLSIATMKTLIRHPPGTSWYAFTRVSKQLTDPDFCMALRQSGCIMLKLGIESGSQDVLDKMHKGTKIEDISTTLKNLAQAGIGTYVYLLFGTPEEEYHQAKQTLVFTSAHAEYINFLNLAIFNMPLSGCSNGEYESIPFDGGDLSLYRDFVHPAGWDRKHVRQFLTKEFRQDKAIKEIIKKDPPTFTSNHAAFFCRQ